jgi:hypothetical protein
MSYNYTKPRVPISAMYTSPGPYLALPTLVGQHNHDPRSVHRKMPAYYLGLLCPIHSESLGPGPAYWLGDMFKDGKYSPPMWTMGKILADAIQSLTPAPGAYRPEDCMKVSHEVPPAYSFGLRHRQARMDNVPGKIKSDGIYYIMHAGLSDCLAVPCYRPSSVYYSLLA